MAFASLPGMRKLLGSAGVGIAATVVDLLVLLCLVEALGVSSVWANGPALAAGAAVQFLGCRHLVFGATGGSLRRQLLGFGLTEAATLALNFVAFHLLVTATQVPYLLARPLGTFVVFAGFSYPLWRRVFTPPKPEPA